MIDQMIDVSNPHSWFSRHARLISFAIPVIIVHLVWWSYMLSKDLLDLFVGTTGIYHKPRWLVSITMIFGSMIAGATSEGGAAVAFPVLTLTLGVSPSIARDFSFMIQSIGMTSAAFSILYMKVKVEYKSIIYCSIGGTCGVIFGLEKIAPKLEPAYSKMYFVCIWFAFAISLFWLNLLHNKKQFSTIPNWDKAKLLSYQFTLIPDRAKVLSHYDIPITVKLFIIEYISVIEVAFNWKAVVLVGGGFLGGIFSSMSGSGLDICSFAILSLLFRLNERISTPTSVILMAINTVIAFMYRRYHMDEISDEAYYLWYVCIPIVVIGAPIGAIASSHFDRKVLTWLIYLIDTAQFIGALYVIQPWTREKTSTPTNLCVTSVVILLAGGIFFTLMAIGGQTLLKYEKNENDLSDTDRDRGVGIGGEEGRGDMEGEGGGKRYRTVDATGDEAGANKEFEICGLKSINIAKYDQALLLNTKQINSIVSPFHAHDANGIANSDNNTGDTYVSDSGDNYSMKKKKEKTTSSIGFDVRSGNNGTGSNGRNQYNNYSSVGPIEDNDGDNEGVVNVLHQ